MFSFVVQLLIISSLILITFSADCQSQKNSDSCKTVSGCQWFNNACECATDVKIDFIFAVDLSSSIGKSAFLQEQEWLSDVVQGGLTKDSRVGWVLFASETDTTGVELKNYTTAELVEYVSNIVYTGGMTDTGGALHAIIDEYTSHGMDSRQKIAIMTTDGNPSHDVCSYATQLKQLDIRLIVLGVGNDLTPKYLTCLLQDPDLDYIPVAGYNYDDFDAILPQLQAITCPVEYDMVISEVKVQPDTYAAFGSRFVEIWNSGSSFKGSDILLSGLANGQLPETVYIDQSQYLVLYDVGEIFKNITCINCVCNSAFNHTQITPPYLYKCSNSVYYPCFTDGSTGCTFADDMDNTNWWQQVNDTTNGINEEVDIARYEGNDIDNKWPTILDGYTFELKNVGYDNHVGSNWDQSCYFFGTPGDAPIECDHSNCTEATCVQNGAEDALLNPSTGECQCPLGYYRSGCTCLYLPSPSNCVALRVKNTTSNTWYTMYEWDPINYDGAVQYQLKYWNEKGTNTTVQSYATIKKVLEYDWDKRGVSKIAGLLRTTIDDDLGNSYFSAWSKCLPFTQNPTRSPTPAPTKTPTSQPSTTPTVSPTHELPWMFIGGNICANQRCDCSEATLIVDKECCMLEEDGCSEYSRRYTALSISSGITEDGTGDKPQYITIQSFDAYGKTYDPPFDTVIYYKFEYLGIVNVNMNSSQYNKSLNSSNVINSDQTPMSITPMNGVVQFDDVDLANEDEISSTKKLTFYIESISSSIVGDGGDALFRFSLLNCSSDYSLNLNAECEIVYPWQYYMYIEQIQMGTELTWWERELKPILWWLIAGLCGFILLVALLTYRFWYRSRLKEAALLTAGDELEELIEEEEYGMAPDLNKEEIGYNPLALRANTKSKISDDNNNKIPKDERANVMVERFREKHEYGQQAGIDFSAIKDDEKKGYMPPKLT